MVIFRSNYITVYQVATPLIFSNVAGYVAFILTDSYIKFYAQRFSGLFAARVLQEYGVEVVVLEARDRAGGRTFTQTVCNIPSTSNSNQIQLITGSTY